MIRKIRNKRGAALLITLALMAMLIATALIAVNRSSTDVDLSFNQLHEEQAFYVAEAGAKRTFVLLDDSNSWRGGYTDVAFGPGAYSVALVDSSSLPALDDTVIIRSRGNATDAVAVVELWTTPVYFYPFKYAMFADKDIFLDKNTCTDSFDSDSGSYATTRLDSAGTVGSNGTIGTSQDVTIGGDVFTATPGGITLGANSTVTGDTSSTQDSVQLDIIPDSEFEWAKANSIAQGGITGSGYTYNNGNRALTLGTYGDVTLSSGVYYFSEITAGQGSSIQLAPGAKVTIYVTGNIRMNQGSSVNVGGSPSDLIIFSKGDSLQFDQDNLFYGAFYGPNAHIQYDQTTQVFGSLVGGTIQLDQAACFHYDRNLSKKARRMTGDMSVVAWREAS